MIVQRQGNDCATSALALLPQAPARKLALTGHLTPPDLTPRRLFEAKIWLEMTLSGIHVSK